MASTRSQNHTAGESEQNKRAAAQFWGRLPDASTPNEKNAPSQVPAALILGTPSRAVGGAHPGRACSVRKLPFGCSGPTGKDAPSASARNEKDPSGERAPKRRRGAMGEHGQSKLVGQGRRRRRRRRKNTHRHRRSRAQAAAVIMKLQQSKNLARNRPGVWVGQRLVRQ